MRLIFELCMDCSFQEGPNCGGLNFWTVIFPTLIFKTPYVFISSNWSFKKMIKKYYYSLYKHLGT